MSIHRKHQFLCIACILLTCMPLLGAAAQKAFTSAQYGFTLRFPGSWSVSVSGAGVPLFFNYRRSQALPQGLLLDGGAEIYVIPFVLVGAMTHADSLDDWIAFNNAHGCSEIKTHHLPNFDSSVRVPHDIVEVESDFERDPQDDQLQRVIDYYFTLHGKKFRLMLVHWKDDPRAAYFRSVLDSVFRSIESL